MFLTSEDCARCGSAVCGSANVFCRGCVIESREWKAMMEVSIRHGDY
jgi:hypothetical protein